MSRSDSGASRSWRCPAIQRGSLSLLVASQGRGTLVMNLLTHIHTTDATARERMPCKMLSTADPIQRVAVRSMASYRVPPRSWVCLPWLRVQCKKRKTHDPSLPTMSLFGRALPFLHSTPPPPRLSLYRGVRTGIAPHVRTSTKARYENTIRTVDGRWWSVAFRTAGRGTRALASSAKEHLRETRDGEVKLGREVLKFLPLDPGPEKYLLFLAKYASLQGTVASEGSNWGGENPPAATPSHRPLYPPRHSPLLSPHPLSFPKGKATLLLATLFVRRTRRLCCCLRATCYLPAHTARSAGSSNAESLMMRYVSLKRGVAAAAAAVAAASVTMALWVPCAVKLKFRELG